TRPGLSRGPAAAPAGTVVSMRRAMRALLTPGWISFTVLIWTAAVVMVLLGRWQLTVSDHKHFDLQNFGYALQWWAFSAAAVLFWAKLIRDALRQRKPENTPTGGQLVVRGQGQSVAHAGPATLVARTDDDAAP